MHCHPDWKIRSKLSEILQNTLGWITKKRGNYILFAVSDKGYCAPDCWSGLCLAYLFRCRFGGFNIRYLYYFNRLGNRWRGILGIHRETLCRTGIDTWVADNTSKTVDLPGLCLFFEQDCLRWTFLHAYPTGDAPASIIHYMAPGKDSLLCWLSRIEDRGRPAHQRFYCRFCHLEKCHLYHRSVQLIQGSMDRTITGTSASSHPCSILISGGIFVRVGVRIRDLARNLVPLPLR